MNGILYAEKLYKETNIILHVDGLKTSFLLKKLVKTAWRMHETQCHVIFTADDEGFKN